MLIFSIITHIGGNNSLQPWSEINAGQKKKIALCSLVLKKSKTLQSSLFKASNAGKEKETHTFNNLFHFYIVYIKLISRFPFFSRPPQNFFWTALSSKQLVKTSENPLALKFQTKFDYVSPLDTCPEFLADCCIFGCWMGCPFFRAVKKKHKKNSTLTMRCVSLLYFDV